jgi:multiple sugar transport system substrate-binding protein
MQGRDVLPLSTSTGFSPSQAAAHIDTQRGSSSAMDKLTTTSGAIGCRRSTWNDAEVNAAIPFYHRIEQLHTHAREIPQRADWPRIAAIIDKLVTAAATTETPIAVLLQQADASFT